MMTNSMLRWTAETVVALAIMGCSYAPTRPDDRACAQEKADVLGRAKDAATDGEATFFDLTVDGRWRCAASVPAENFILDVSVTWSDGTEEYKRAFLLRTEPGRQYSVLAYQAGVGHVPVTAKLTAVAPPAEKHTPRSGSGPRSVGQAAAGGFALALLSPIWVPLGIVSAPITIPLAIIKSKNNSENARKKHAKFAGDCCYLWIEDAKTGQIIAGSTPPARESKVRADRERKQ